MLLESLIGVMISEGGGVRMLDRISDLITHLYAERLFRWTERRDLPLPASAGV